MPAKFATANSYTAAEMLALWTETSAQIAATGVSYAIAGRSFACADPDAAMRSIAFWESRVNQDEAPAANLARLVRR
jgi:hypothetical protein